MAGPDQQSAITFRHHSSRVKVAHHGRHLWRLDYSGIMGDKAFTDLRAQAIAATPQAQLLHIHMERSLVSTHIMPPPYRAVYRGNTCPAVVVVRPDQWQVWKDYADAMERIGITRVIFLESQQAQAQRWLDCLQAIQGQAVRHLRA